MAASYSAPKGESVMVDLTVVILTKNEEKNLRKCVESFHGIAKRFVIIDSGSTDGTRNLCEQLDTELRTVGSRLDFYVHPWTSYSDQLNWGLENTGITTEWSMRMDADEELLQELVSEIAEKLGRLREPVNGIVLRRRTIFMGRWIRHGGRYPELLLRIFRTGKAKCEMKMMDEHMILSDGTMVTFDHDLIDNNQKDLDWWTSKHNWYSNREVLDYQMSFENDILQKNGATSIQARIKRTVKKSGYYKLPKFFRAHIYFLYRYWIRLGFLDGTEGRIYHFLQAYWYRFLVDAKMYQCEKTGTKMQPQGDLKT